MAMWPTLFAWALRGNVEGWPFDSGPAGLRSG